MPPVGPTAVEALPYENSYATERGRDVGGRRPAVGDREAPLAPSAELIWAQQPDVASIQYHGTVVREAATRSEIITYAIDRRFGAALEAVSSRCLPARVMLRSVHVSLLQPSRQNGDRRRICFCNRVRSSWGLWCGTGCASRTASTSWAMIMWTTTAISRAIPYPAGSLHQHCVMCVTGRGQTRTGFTTSYNTDSCAQGPTARHTISWTAGEVVPAGPARHYGSVDRDAAKRHPAAGFPPLPQQAVRFNSSADGPALQKRITSFAPPPPRRK
jgi:hypothetical protein